MPRIILRAAAFGLIVETAALALSCSLYSLRHGREPMEPPFNLIATTVQMPGIFLSDWLAESWGIYAGWFRWSVVFTVQVLLWSFIGLAVLLWRASKRSRSV